MIENQAHCNAWFHNVYIYEAGLNFYERDDSICSNYKMHRCLEKLSINDYLSKNSLQMVFVFIIIAILCHTIMNYGIMNIKSFVLHRLIWPKAKMISWALILHHTIICFMKLQICLLIVNIKRVGINQTFSVLKQWISTFFEIKMLWSLKCSIRCLNFVF